MDAIDASAALVRLYQIERVRPDARELARIISAFDRAGRHGAEGAREEDGSRRAARSRSTGSRTRPTAPTRRRVRRLFEEERDPIAIIKWKEILDFLEDATDRCEDVANVLEGVVVKHA